MKKQAKKTTKQPRLLELADVKIARGGALNAYLNLQGETQGSIKGSTGN